MKSCLKVPRILLPQEGYEKWAVIACDQFTSDRGYWERVARYVGDEPSTLRFILPEALLGEDDEKAFEAVQKNMYAALERGDVCKLSRGCVLTKRTTSSGVREGIVCAIDLEAYTMGKGELSPIRSSEEVVSSRLQARIELRKRVPLEFPHAILFYQDKKGKVQKLLKGEELEKLYSFDLMEGGGHIEGYFLDEGLSLSLARAMMSRGEPSLAVADGNHSVAAAKAYWEELKTTLTERECATHPARYMLVELVNLYDDSVVFHPIHRLVKDVESEVFCDFFTRRLKGKCARKGNLLYPVFPKAADGVKLCDELCEEYCKQNGGAIDYIHGEKELEALAGEDCVGIVLKTIEKDDFFAQLKDGGNFPKKTFSVGEATEKRYYLEGREISYE